MGESIYRVGECDYCSEDNRILRPTPFLGDIPAMMCEYCWEETRKEYAACNGEYIGKFDECAGYEQAKEGVITDESIKEILESIIEFSDNDTSVEKFALQRIKDLEIAVDGFVGVVEQKDEEIEKLAAKNRELVNVLRKFYHAYDGEDLTLMDKATELLNTEGVE